VIIDLYIVADFMVTKVAAADPKLHFVEDAFAFV